VLVEGTLNTSPYGDQFGLIFDGGTELSLAALRCIARGTVVEQKSYMYMLCLPDKVSCS